MAKSASLAQRKDAVLETVTVVGIYRGIETFQGFLAGATLCPFTVWPNFGALLFLRTALTRSKLPAQLFICLLHHSGVKTYSESKKKVEYL